MTESQNFWSRRRAGVQAEVEAEAAERQSEAIAAEEVAQQDKSDAELLAEFDLPDPDAMKPGDDFSAFMKSAVPDRLRRRALRKLWLTNPVLANVDGLVDYGEDYTDAALVIENLQTAYQVGKGMTKHVEEMARQAAEDLEPDTIPEEEEDPDAETIDVAEQDKDVENTPEVDGDAGVTEDALETAGLAAEPLRETVEPEEELAFQPRRRMQFAYVE